MAGDPVQPIANVAGGHDRLGIRRKTLPTDPATAKARGSAESLAPIHRTPLIEEVSERLVNFIVQEGLEPGDRLPAERHLSERLGVGRSTIREAVQSLRAIGVVELSQRGMTVGDGNTTVLTRPLSWGLLMNVRSGQELIDARRVIEIGLAGMAAEHATQEDLAEMERALIDMRATFASVEAFATADLAFHLAVARAAHNFLLLHVIDTLQHVIRTWIESVAETRREQEHLWIREHRRVFEAIRERRVSDARDAMNDHLGAAGVRLVEAVQGPFETPE